MGDNSAFMYMMTSLIDSNNKDKEYASTSEEQSLKEIDKLLYMKVYNNLDNITYSNINGNIYSYILSDKLKFNTNFFVSITNKYNLKMGEIYIKYADKYIPISCINRLNDFNKIYCKYYSFLNNIKLKSLLSISDGKLDDKVKLYTSIINNADQFIFDYIKSYSIELEQNQLKDCTLTIDLCFKLEISIFINKLKTLFNVIHFNRKVKKNYEFNLKGNLQDNKNIYIIRMYAINHLLKMAGDNVYIQISNTIEYIFDILSNDKYCNSILDEVYLLIDELSITVFNLIKPIIIDNDDTKDIANLSILNELQIRTEFFKQMNQKGEILNERTFNINNE